MAFSSPPSSKDSMILWFWEYFLKGSQCCMLHRHYGCPESSIKVRLGFIWVLELEKSCMIQIKHICFKGEVLLIFWVQNFQLCLGFAWVSQKGKYLCYMLPNIPDLTISNMAIWIKLDFHTVHCFYWERQYCFKSAVIIIFMLFYYCVTFAYHHLHWKNK